MKKHLLLAGLLLTGGISWSQSIVTTYSQYKTAVLEEYTGIYCTFCPDGHKRASEMKAAYPNQVVLVNVHTGGYASPNGNDPDFRTPFGPALASQTGLTGYPSGTINRRVFPTLGSAMALNRGQWRTAGEMVIAERSPVNIGATTSYDPNTRTLTVNVEGYYTQAGSGAYHLLNVALLQDSVVGPQVGASANPSNVLPGGMYRHDHMLRHLISGQWGDTISNISAGALYTKTFTYVLPANINGVVLDPSHCEVALYISETKGDIIQGISLGIDGQTNDGNNATFYGEFQNSNTAVKAGNPGTPEVFSFNFQSATPVAQDFVFELTEEAPSSWSGSYSVGGNTYNGKATVNIAALANSAVSLSVSPGGDAAVGRYILKAYPTNDTDNVTSMTFNVISGVKELIVNGTGAFGDGQQYNWEPDYVSAMAATGSSTYAVTDANVMEEAVTNQALNGVEDIYLNMGWTFPAFSDDQADALKDFMTKGGNVFVAGQDVGWDINASNGNGTATTRDLFTNYFNVVYVADGSTANNQLIPEGSDPIFGSASTSSVVDKYAGNMYPDELRPGNASAASIFYYDQAKTKTGGTRHQGSNYKVVYFGIGLEMISDVAVRDYLMDVTYNWFKGNISTDEFDLLTKGFDLYPNPGSSQLTIEVPVSGNYNIQLINATGTVVMELDEDIRNGKVELSELDLNSGLYIIQMSYGNQSVSKRWLVK